MPRSLIAAHEFHRESWDAIAARAEELASLDSKLSYLPELVTSIRESGVEDRLGARFSMTDLHIAEIPMSRPPVEYLAVKRPSGRTPPVSGEVRIEHHTVSGRNDSIDRASAEVVPLFWRFAREKFGLLPN